MLALATLERLHGALVAGARARPGGADAARERSGRRAQGAYFTPLPLVELVVAEAVGARLGAGDVRWGEDGAPALRVLDPSAGDGRFLAAAVEALADAATARGHGRDAARAAIARRCVIGIERDPEFAAMARARLGQAHAIHCREALCDAPAEARGVDIIVGNPPYLRSIHMARADQALWRALQGRYAATSHGEWDLYAAFVEQALDWAAPGAEIGLVVPSRWFTAAFAARLRARLAGARAVRAIVDFGAAQVFAGATTYAAAVFLSRTPQARVAVARLGTGGWERGTIPAATLTATPWRLAVGARRALLDRLAAAGPALGQVARIAKGAGTNADRVYVLERAAVDGELVRGVSRAAGEVCVERAACRPCARGRDVRPFGAISGAVQCIVPYDRDGALWTPERLAAHPLARAYLERTRAALEAREGGRYRDERYYRFGRPQNLALLTEPRAKIVVPDVARGGRALCDSTGALVLDTAYAIRPRSETWLGVILAVLNSPVVALWLGQTGVLLRGGYVRMKTAYLASLPLPPPSPATERLHALLGAGRAAGPELDELVRRAYGMDADLWAELAQAAPV